MEPTTEVFVCGPFGSRFSACVFPQGSSVRDVVERFVQQWAPASARDFYVTRDGGVTLPDECLRGGAVYRLAPRLLGGKGGFGSMLRALGAQIEKTTNREACRDLSGRRLRDVNHEKEMGEWLKQQADREADKEQRRAERLQRKMAEPKHQFSDPAYQRQCHSLAERLEDSVLKGLQAASGSAAAAASKRPGPARHQPPAKKKKKKTAGACSWTGLEDMSSEDEDDEDEPSRDEDEPSRDDDAAAAQEAEPATGKGMPAPTSGEAHPEETASSGEERGVAAGRSPAPRRAEAVDEADGEGASASV